MEDLQSAQEMRALTQPFLDSGFTMEYTYQKGGDSSCVYIYRYKKGGSYFDLREVSGSTDITFVVFTNGGYQFPSLKSLSPKAYGTFRRKHIFRKATRSEMRVFVTDVLKEKLRENPHEFFGILI